jgi:transposase
MPEVSGAFVAGMEDVIAVYHLPYDPTIPTLCLDEYGLALTADTHPPLPPRPGAIAKQDYEYSREGSCTLFGAFEPQTGQRIIRVEERRTRREFAAFIKTILTEHYPDAPRVRLVLDNLNIHTPGALYETFPAAEARTLAQRIEWHFTPKHGSWLNLQEIEWAILKRQLFRHQRLASVAAVQQAAAAWAAGRTERRLQVDWRFTVADARRTMHHCYPIPSTCPDTA